MPAPSHSTVLIECRFVDSTQRSEEEIILCQVAFLRDTGILCDSLSILDLVALRSSQMSSQRHESDRHFSYELFYAWLRSISGLVYPSEHNSRKAFHALLTEVLKLFCLRLKSTN